MQFCYSRGRKIIPPTVCHLGTSSVAMLGTAASASAARLNSFSEPAMNRENRCR